MQTDKRKLKELLKKGVSIQEKDKIGIMAVYLRTALMYRRMLGKYLVRSAPSWAEKAEIEHEGHVWKIKRP